MKLELWVVLSCSVALFVWSVSSQSCSSPVGSYYNSVTNSCICRQTFREVNDTCACNYTVALGNRTCMKDVNCANFGSSFYISYLLWEFSNASLARSNGTILSDIETNYGIGNAELQTITHQFLDLAYQGQDCDKRFQKQNYTYCLDPIYDSLTDLYFTILIYNCDGPLCSKPYEHWDKFKCVCDSGFIRNGAGLCDCPQFEEIANGTCVCQSGFIRDSNSGRCICPPGHSVVNNTCVISSTGPECVCGENEYYDTVQRACFCIDGYIRIDGVCVAACTYCQENEEYDYQLKACVCKSGYSRPSPNANCTLT